MREVMHCDNLLSMFGPIGRRKPETDQVKNRIQCQLKPEIEIMVEYPTGYVFQVFGCEFPTR